MKPGDRVQLIRQLAEHLFETEWTELDLTLRQFGLPWEEQWSGQKQDYLLLMLERGDDQKLLDLHEHLFGSRGAPSADQIPSYWEPGYFKLFVCHVVANKQFCSELKGELLDFGISSFVAHQDIEPTREWVDEIERALATCDALVAVLSEGFKESDWTDQELGICHGRRVLIVSVRQGVDPYGFISRYQALRGGRAGGEVAADLYDVFIKHEKTAARAAEGLVATFERSINFATAKRRANRLRDVVSWTPDLLRRIEGAVTSNKQVQDAWAVPGIVAGLVKEHGAGADEEPIDYSDIPF